MKKIPFILIILMLAVLTACSANSSTTPDSGVEGQVLIGPVCPVEQPGDTCPDRPYQATLTVNNPQGEKVVQIETDEEGKFKITLEPGSYVLVPESTDMIPFASEQPFTVAEGKYTQLTVAFDSGIR